MLEVISTQIYYTRIKIGIEVMKIGRNPFKNKIFTYKLGQICFSSLNFEKVYFYT